MQNVERIVHEAVLDIARQQGSTLTKVTGEHHLTSDLGFKSLDIARLVALLELELGVDPFAGLVPITDVRTVGDVCAAYHRAIEQQAAPAHDPLLEASRARGERRRRTGGQPTDPIRTDNSAE